MKTNMINTNSVMRTICAVVLMLLGMSVSAWGAKTGTIEFGNENVKINSASVTGDDSQGNTWTITTVGTSSYTPQSTYSQVGSSKAPATSITFTMTLPSSKNITAFSAKFGGFKDTAGTIKLKVGDTEVGSGSLSASSDVLVSNNKSAVGSVLTVTVTSIDKGVKCYYVSCTYANPSAYTVTYNAEGGTCGTASQTEGSAEAGVVLPAASTSVSMASMGWGFYGWAEDAVDDPTETAPTIVGKAGDTYYPDEDITLHAVFAKGEYTKETSAITENGKYLIVATNGGHNYLMTNKLSTYEADSEEYGQLAGKLIDETSTNKYSASSIHADYVFTIVTSASVSVSTGNWMIKNVSDNKYVSADYQDLYITDISSADGNTITSTSGAWEIENVYNSTSKIQYNTSENQFRANSTASSLLIYKETVTPKYCSNPSTVRLVASPAAGGTVVFDDNSSDEMDFADEYIGDITATPNSGYDFLNWESSVSGSDIEIDPTVESKAAIDAKTSATITANFYQRRSISYILTEGGVAGEGGNPTTVTKDEKDGFVVGFNLQAHYKDMTLVSVTMGGSPMTEGSEADYEWEVDGSTAMLTIHHDNIDGDIEITVSATHMEYTKYAFSCSELTLTPHLATTGTPIFITSTASKTVRSQDYIEITGNGLTPNTELSFGELGKFAIKNADGTAVTTDVNGEISANAYIFYTPDAGDTSDGLDKLTGITVSVEGAKPKTVNLTQDIIGRHLPADFVIAGKVGNKWYALPADFSEESTPDPVEIAVNDINNPSLAYTASTNIYNLYGQNSGASGFLYNDGDDDGNPDGEKIKLGMKNNSNKPLFAFASPKNSLKGDGTATVTNNINKQYWWTLKQTNTTSNITNAQDAKYILTSSNNSGTLSIKNSPFVWGTYATGVEELRLIPASDIVFTEAYFVEWGQHGGVIEVDAQGIDATSVTAHLGVNSATTTLSQTLTSGKSRASKYNYTVNFGVGIDFAATASNGAMLTLEWKNGATTKAVSNIVVPKIVAASATMSSLMDTDDPWNSANVHVLPGVTLTANAGDFSSKDVVIDRLEIYPGATVKVTKGSQDVGTLKVRTLVLRNGWTRVGSKNYDVARLYVSTDANLAKNAVDNIWYSDWYIDYDQYYPIAVPFPVATSGISYKNTKSSATGGVTIRYYDGERRAEHEQQNQEDNWVAYTWGGTMPANLEPSKGYAMTAKRPSGKAFSIVRMPMTFSNPWTALGEHGYVGETHKDQVTVTGWGKGTTSWYAMGWNFVGNPYMCTFNGNDDGISGKITTQEGGNVKYATIPDLEFKNYYQVPIVEANLKPASGFFIQADNASPQTITFNAAKIVPPSAPARYTVQQERIPEQEAYIRLSYEGGNDLMGLIIGEDYTEGYEPNADLAKVLGGANAVKTYMHYADMDMAYVAINETLAKEWIPVTVNIPADGEYTYSLTSYSEVNDLEGVYLIDYMNSNQVTNLIEEDYTFVAEAGTSANRFSINAKVGQRNTPTDIDIINAGGDINSSKPLKFLWNDKVFILHNGVIYDATGKKVREINK